MADWRKVAMRLCLADGVIDDSEIKILKKELYADGKIDKKEVEFLIELRNEAQKKAKGSSLPNTFENFFFKAIQDNVLSDGKIDDKEANWLRKMLFADNKIDDAERKFLNKLKKAATQSSPKFEKLYDDCMAVTAK